MFNLFNHYFKNYFSAKQLVDKDQHSSNAIHVYKTGLIHTGSGYGSTIATTQTTEWSTSRTAVSTTERTTTTTTTTSREVTTDSVSPSTTLMYTKDSTSTMSTSSEAGL